MKDHPMQKLLEKHKVEIKPFKLGDVVPGVVVSSSHKEILVDVGAKSEGIISHIDMEDSAINYKDLSPGDSIFATVIQAENDQGYVVLSMRKAEKEKKWKDLEEGMKNGAAFEVKVIEYNKGGILVDCLGLRGFIPLSHLDKSYFSDTDAKFTAGSEAELKEKLSVLSGKVLRVKVIELDQSKNRLVLSEKEAKSNVSEEDKKKKLEAISEGSTLSGIVTGVMPFGVFVDIDGVEGLVHISEIAWEKVSHPNKYFAVGDKIAVLVLGIDRSSGKLALSVKRLTQNPWENVEDRYPVGSVVEGVVSKIVPFGAFVNLEKGLDGLVHISEAAEPMKEGDKIKAIVVTVDGPNQKLALSVRQLEK